MRTGSNYGTDSEYMRRNKQMKKLFYGWVIALTGLLVLGVTHGVIVNCFSLYIIPVSEDFGCSREAFSMLSLIVNVIYALMSFCSGRIYKHIPVMRLMRLSSIVLPLSYLTYSFCTGLTQMMLTAVAVGLSLSCMTFVPFSIVLANWFEEERGKALGIAFMGSGVGGMVMNYFAARVMDCFGWRMSMRLTAAVMLLILVPACFFIIREKPEEMGLKPLGLKSAEAGIPVTGPTAREAIPTLSFAAVSGLALFIGFDSIVFGNIVNPHLIDLGYSTVYASTVVSVYLGCLAAAKYFLGSLYDRIGAIRGTRLSMLCFILGFFGLYNGRAVWSVPLIMLGAMGTASSNVSYPVLARHAFGTRDYAVLNGILMGINYVTCAIGVPLANMVFSLTGNYNGVFLLSGLLAFISVLLLPLIRPVKGQAEERSGG